MIRKGDRLLIRKASLRQPPTPSSPRRSYLVENTKCFAFNFLRFTNGKLAHLANSRGTDLSLNEPFAENPEGMGEQESQSEAVGMGDCVAEGEGRGSSTDLGAAAQ